MFIQFTNPIYLVLLFIIPIFVFVHFASMKNKSKPYLKFANFEAIAKIKGIDLYSKNTTLLIMNSLIILFLILSLCGTSINLKREVSEHAFVIAIDASQSMGATDVFPDRITLAKNIAAKIVDDLPENTQIALISIGTYNKIEQETTTNKKIIKEKIKNIRIWGMGTQLYETAITSSNLLFNFPGKSVIILSDGQTTPEDLSQTIFHANQKGLAIHTIQVGTEEGGKAMYGISKANQTNLKELSEKTKGNFLSNETSEEKISINEIIQTHKGVVQIQISKYLLLIAIVLFLLEHFLSNNKYAHRI